MRRPFLTRLVLATLGMLFLCLAGYAALGWVVKNEPRWLSGIMTGDRRNHLVQAYGRTLGRLFPTDTDGDGIADATERYLRWDHENPYESYVTDFIFDGGGFTCSHRESGDLGEFLFHPGERRRIRARLGVDREPAVYAEGTLLIVGAGSPGLICPPGEEPSTEEILIPVERDGSVAFDLVIPEDTMTPAKGNVGSQHPQANFVGGFHYLVAHRRPPIPCTWKDVPPNDPSYETVSLENQPKGTRTVRLTWQSAGTSGPYYLEATRSVSAQDWFLVGECPATATTTDLFYRLYDYAPGDQGPIRFRVVPTEAPPQS